MTYVEILLSWYILDLNLKIHRQLVILLNISYKLEKKNILRAGQVMHISLWPKK